MVHKLPRRALFIGFILAGIGSSQIASAFVIDTFSDSFQRRYDSTTGDGFEGVYVTGSSAWLGSRIIATNQVASPIGGIAISEVENGWFGANSPLSTSLCLIVYGASGWNQTNQTFSYSPSRNEDLSMFSGVRLTVEAASAGTVFGWDMYDNNLSVHESRLIRKTLATNITSTTTVDLMFASPVSTSANFTTGRVDYAELRTNLANVPGGGFAISKVEFIPVPEPATFIALGAGVATLLRRRRNRGS